MNQSKYDKFIDDVNCINNPSLRRRITDNVDSLLDDLVNDKEVIKGEIIDCIGLLSRDGINSKAAVKSKLQALLEVLMNG